MFVHYKRKNLILKSRPLSLIYCQLTHDDVGAVGRSQIGSSERRNLSVQ